MQGLAEELAVRVPSVTLAYQVNLVRLPLARLLRVASGMVALTWDPLVRTWAGSG